MISVELDDRAVRTSGVLADAWHQRAAQRAVNRAAPQLRTMAVRAIVQRVRLKAGYVRERLDIRLARPGETEARVYAVARGTRLDRYPNKQVYVPGKTVPRKRGGIAVSVVTSRPSERIASAFYVPLRSGKQDGGNGFGIALRLDVLQRQGNLQGNDLDYESSTGRRGRQYVVLHSASVRSEFRWAIPDLLPPIRAALAREYLRQLTLNRGASE